MRQTDRRVTPTRRRPLLRLLAAALLLAPVLAHASPAGAAMPGTGPDNVGLHDPESGWWYLRTVDGDVLRLLYGNAADVPFLGDWDCDGDATPGLYRPTDGKVYLRNSLSTGIADVEYFFGDPADVPIAGDFDGDGCDTVSLYRPSTGTFHIENSIGSGNRGIGSSDRQVVLGGATGVPIAGDFDGDGIATPGLHDPSRARVVLATASHPTGAPPFSYGNAGDRSVVGDWDGDGVATIGVFRPPAAAFHLRDTNDRGPADTTWSFGEPGWTPVVWARGPLRLDVTATISPATVPHPGGTVQVTLRVANRSAATTLTLLEFRDDGDGDGDVDVVLAAADVCAATALPAGATTTCRFSRDVTGRAGASVPGTVSVVAAGGEERVTALSTQRVQVLGRRDLTGFSSEIVATGLRSATSLAFLPDGRLLVVQKGGGVAIGDPGAGIPMVTEPYMEIMNLDSDAERGLLDLTFDPDFASNGHVYLYYTPATPARGRISRFTHVEGAGGTASRGDLASEVVVWEDTDGYLTCCHYGAGLDFGPDGNLWLTPGDRGRAADIPQALDRSGGKVLRIAPDGSVPAGNPFADGPGGNHDYVFALGLRNPFRARWDIPAGDVHASAHGRDRLFIGEVGSDNTVGWEDVHVLTMDDAGANLGWPYCEGLGATANPDFPTCADHLDPVFAYPHAGEGASITGGVVYRGSQYPPEWQGVYFYGDFVRHFVGYLEFDAEGERVVAAHEFAPTDAIDTIPRRVVAMDVGPDGALYVLSHDGLIRRFVYEAGNQPPDVAFSATPPAGPEPLDVEFRARATDPEAAPLTYRLAFGDGTADAVGAVPPGGDLPPIQHRYREPGRYLARFEASDGVRTTVAEDVVIDVGTPPVATITSPADEQAFVAGERLSLTGSCSGTPHPCSTAWTIRFGHNEHFHPELGPVEAGSLTWVVPRRGHDFTETTWFEIALRATDAVTGLTDSHVIELRPTRATVSFTAPPGIVLQVDGRAKLAPFQLLTLVGFDHEVEAPTPQCVAGAAWEFTGWSDGEARRHAYRVPAAGGSLAASYEPAGSC